MFNNTIFGIIYLIKHKNCDDKKVYVGSTINLKRRILDHKKNCNNQKCKQYNLKIYQYIRENGGFNMYRFIILECYVCNFKHELYDREDDYIKIYPNNLNTLRAYLTREQHKEANKKYRDENKEELKQKHKKYYDENKDKIKDKIKKYKDENKDKIKERISEKITCECGSIVRKNEISRHRKTLKHIHYTEKK